MAETKRGITFEIGGNTQPLTKALRESKDEVKLLASETKKLQGEFKFAPNLDKVNEMLKTNRKSAEELSNQINMLEQGLAKIERTGSLANISDIKSMTRDLNNAKAALSEVNAEKQKLENFKLSDFGRELELTTQKAELLRDRLDIKITKNDVVEFQKAAQEQIIKTNERLERLKKLMSEIAESDPNAASAKEFKKLENQVISLENELQNAAKSIKEVDQQRLDAINEQFQKIGGNINNVAKAITPLSVAISGAIGLGVKAAAGQESAFAGVRKTVEATEDRYARLKAELIELSEVIPTAATDLMGIAESAGQLGIKTENVAGFTRTMADLGVATNLTGEEAASTLAKFANITQMPQENFDRLGSTIVALGNKFATTEKDIANMSMRIAAAGKGVGLTEAEIASFAAALSSVGLEAEAGGTAFSTAIKKIQLAVETGNKDLDNFARVAGMSARDFKKAFENDAAGAITAFIKGLNSGLSDGESVTKILDDMGISGLRLTDALSRSAIANNVFTAALNLGTQAWEENNALTEEANKRYDTTESKMIMVKNQIQNLGAEFGELLLPMIQKITGGVSDFAGWLNSLDEGTKRNVLQIGLFVAALAPALSIVGNVTKAAGGLWTAMAAHPILAVTAAVAALTAGLINYAAAASSSTEKTLELNKKLEENRQAYENAKKAAEDKATVDSVELDKVERLIPKYEELNKKVDKTREEKERLKNIVEEINKIIPDVIGKINEETGAYETQTSTLNELIAAKRKMIEATLIEEDATARMRQQRENVKYRDEAQENLDDLVQQYASKYAPNQREIDKMKSGLYDWDALTMTKLSGSINLPKYQQSPEAQLLLDITDALKSVKNYNTTIAEDEAEINRLWGIVFDQPNESALADSSGSSLFGKTFSDLAAVGANMAGGIADQYRKNIITKARAETASFDEILNLVKLRSGATDEQKKEIDEIYNYELASIENLAQKKIISEEESLKRKKDLNDAYNRDNKTALLNLETQYEKDLANLQSENSKDTKSGDTKSDKSTVEKEKTPEELYKSAVSDVEFQSDYNVKINGKDETEELIANADEIAKLRKEYLTEGTREYKESLIKEQKLRDKYDDEKKKSDKEAADKKLKDGKDKYDKDLQQLKDALEDKKISWEKYYQGLVKLQENNADYLSREGNGRIARSLGKEIEKALSESQNEIIAALQESYANDEIGFAEFISRYKQYAEEFYADNKEMRQKAYDNITQTTADYCNSELAAIQKMYNDGLISLDEYIRQYSEKMSEFYDVDSEEYKKGEQKLTNEKEAKYREEKEYKDWLRSMGMLADKEYYDDLLGLAAEYLDEDSKLWRDAMQQIYNFRSLETEKKLKDYEDYWKARQKILDDNLKEEKLRIAEQKKEAENRHKEEVQAKKDAAKKAYDERIKEIDEELNAEKTRLNAIIEGIDEEIKKRRELREDESHEDKIARARKALEAAKAEVAFERDDFTKENLNQEVIRRQQELDKLIQERGDTIFYRNKETEKSEIEEQLKSIEDVAKSAKDAANEQMDAALAAAESTDKLNRELAALSHTLEVVNDIYEIQTDSIKRQLEKQVDEVDIAGDLIKKYLELSGKIGEAADKKEKLFEAIQKYEQKLPGLILGMDRERIAYEKLKNEAENLIEAKERLMSMTSAAVSSSPSSADSANAASVPSANVNVNIAYTQTPEQFDLSVRKIAQPLISKIFKKAMEGG